MNPLSKVLAIIGIIIITLIILIAWYVFVIVGWYNTSPNTSSLILGSFVPFAVIVLAIFLIIKIVRKKTSV